MTPALASQNRTGRAIRGEDADGETRFRGHDGVSFGQGLPRLLGHDRLGAVLLEHREQAVRLHAQQFGDARAILRHVFRGVARAWAAIERGIDAGGNAALAREEPMAHAGSVEAGAESFILSGVTMTGWRK